MLPIVIVEVRLQDHLVAAVVVALTMVEHGAVMAVVAQYELFGLELQE
jgi:hypothetical protein